MSVEDIAINLIALHEGELVGRPKLQKRAYLLHQCGADFDLPFVYHHYGPYSFDLMDGVAGARAKGRVDVEERFGRYGVRYEIYRLKEGFEPPEGIGRLTAATARERLAEMKKVSDDVLEIAATIVFLREDGNYPDRAEEETKARKSRKATDENMAQARTLLNALGLSAKAARG